MNENRFNINISGGNVNIGTATQGDKNHISVSSQNIDTNVDENYIDFLKSLSELRNTVNISDDQINSLTADVRELREIIENSSQPKDSFIDKVRELYEKYSWASGALKKLFTTVFV